MGENFHEFHDLEPPGKVFATKFRHAPPMYMIDLAFHKSFLPRKFPAILQTVLYLFYKFSTSNSVLLPYLLPSSSDLSGLTHLNLNGCKQLNEVICRSIRCECQIGHVHEHDRGLVTTKFICKFVRFHLCIMIILMLPTFLRMGVHKDSVRGWET